jgi:hypothetical protein
MVRGADNDNDLAAAKGKDGRGVIEFVSMRLRGRTDLFALAVATRKAMLEKQAQLMQLSTRRKSAARAEQRQPDRDIHGAVSVYRRAGMRLLAIEDAMEPDMRVEFWQLVDTEDAWK